MLGKKDTTGKLPFHLLSGPALEEIVKVLEYGRNKPNYTDRQWEDGIYYDELFQALQRHAWKWWSGHDKDDDEKGSGLSHMAHVACLAMFLLHFEKCTESGLYQDREDLDNRPVDHAIGISNCGDPAKAPPEDNRPKVMPIHPYGGNAAETVSPLTVQKIQGQQI